MNGQVVRTYGNLNPELLTNSAEGLTEALPSEDHDDEGFNKRSCGPVINFLHEWSGRESSGFFMPLRIHTVFFVPFRQFSKTDFTSHCCSFF